MTTLVKVLTVIAMAALVAGMAFEAHQPPKGQLVIEEFTVAPGDGLDSIAWRVIQKSSVRRDIREVREGIIELNYEQLKGRPPGLIYPGEKLKVSYWVKSE